MRIATVNLHPLTVLVGQEFVKVWLRTVTYDDPTPENLMFSVDDGCGNTISEWLPGE